MAAILVHEVTKFHISLNVTDLVRSTAFYRTLLGVAPAKVKHDYAKFELLDPPVILSLVPVLPVPGGTVNHIGIRLSNADALAAMQKRLEAAGMAINLEKNVQCCHAVQSKFWVTDPDQTLWELYIFHEDIEDDAPPGKKAEKPPVVNVGVTWQHRIPEPFPTRIPHADNSLMEVALKGTGNMTSFATTMDAIMTEALRALRPGGKVTMHVLTGDASGGSEHPHLPGPASVVEYVPVESAPVDAMKRAGFVRIQYEKLAQEPCFVVNQVRMRETKIVGYKAGHRPRAVTHAAIYLGPLAQVTDDFGNIFQRGKRVALNIHDWQQLSGSAVANHFLLVPPESTEDRSCS